MSETKLLKRLKPILELLPEVSLPERRVSFSYFHYQFAVATISGACYNIHHCCFNFSCLKPITIIWN